SKPVKLWDVSNPQAPRQIGSLDSMWPQHAVFSPDGTRLAICANQGAVRLFEFPSLRELEPLRGQPGIHGWLAFSPDGRRLASAGGNLCICIWDLEHPEKLQMLKGHDKDPQCLAFTPDGNTVGVTSAGSARWCEMPSLRLLKEEPADLLVFAQDGGFAMLARQGQIIRRDYPSGVEASLGSSAIVGRTSAALSPDGGTFVIGGKEGKMALWHTHRPGPQTMLEGHKGRIQSVAF